MLREDPDGEVLQRLDVAGLNHRPILLSSTSDLALDGRSETQWLVVTSTHVNVVAKSPEPEIRQSFPLDEAETFRTCSGVGSGLLQARRGSEWVDLLRYSNAGADRFHKIAGKLEDLRETGELVVHPDEEVDKGRCARCGLRLAGQHESCPRCLQGATIAARLWEFIRPQSSGIALLMLVTVIGVAAELVPPKLQQYLVDDVLGASGRAPDFSRTLVVIVLALAGSRFILSFLAAMKGRLGSRIGNALTASLRARLVEKMQKLSIAYYDRHHVGTMMSRVTYDAESVYGLVQQLTSGFLMQILQLVGVGIMLFMINPTLAAYTLIPVPLVVAGSWYYWRRIYPRYYRYYDSCAKQSAALSSMLHGIRAVKGFAQEESELERYHRANEYMRSTRFWVEHSGADYTAWMQLIFSLGGLIVWYVGGDGVLGGSMTLGSLIAFLAYLALFYAPLGSLAQFTTWVTSFFTGAKRVLELLDTPSEASGPEQSQPTPPALGNVAFREVRFGYERHHPILKDLSFEVAAGEMVGVVGRSGAGKSTLINLLSRFYDVNEGSVLVDGVDVREYPLKELRRRIGVVFQEPQLFRATIRDNICFGRKDAPFEQALAAASAAGAHDFILRSALAYETPLGEHGAGLSGGEKQRLSIARAVLYDPPILVLDEATSNVDTESERAIQETLTKLMKGRTTIAIAHRLSTLRSASRILVFDRGAVAEQGSHEELMAKDGIYARLVRIQTDWTGEGEVEGAASASPTQAAGPERPAVRPELSVDPNMLKWLDPAEVRFEVGAGGSLRVHIGDSTHPAAFAIRCLPATRPDEYLSIRVWNASGDERELGLVRRMSDWPESSRNALREALRRRYLLRRIQRIDSLEVESGLLAFRVSTDTGPASFHLRWAQSSCMDFGPDGKMLFDTEDNRYVVPDVNALAPSQRELFRRHVYW